MTAEEYADSILIDKTLKRRIKKYMDIQKKQQINMISLKDYLRGRKYSQLPKEEQLEIAQKILMALFPESQNE